MSDTFQAVYSGTRSALACDAGSAIDSAARDCFDISWAVPRVMESITIAAMDIREQQTRPSTIYRPSLSIDGNQWCALYGDNLQDGVAGFGGSPEAAMIEFDRNWKARLGNG